jgi:hypothetical protein
MKAVNGQLNDWHPEVENAGKIKGQAFNARPFVTQVLTR